MARNASARDLEQRFPALEQLGAAAARAASRSCSS